MENYPRWLYPGRAVDRSVSARASRFYERLTGRFDAGLTTPLRLVRETATVANRHASGMARTMGEAWMRYSIRPQMFASQMLWAVGSENLGEFVRGAELDPFFRATLDPDDRALMRNKARFAEHCRRNGIPSVETLAVVGGADEPWSPDIPRITRREDLAGALLAVGRGRELFLKPVIGKHGYGAYRITADGRAIDKEGAAVGAATLTADVFDYRHPAGDQGYLLQPFVEPGTAMIELAGARDLATLRVITAVRGGRPSVLRAFVKFPAAGRLTNNFLGGSTGSLLSDVDIATGCLGPLVGVMRRGFRFAVEASDTHPVSGRVFRGRELPGWSEARSIAERGAALHSKTATLGWDLAYGIDGWIVLEANTMWGASGAQAAARRGLRPDLRSIFPEHWSRLSAR